MHRYSKPSTILCYIDCRFSENKKIIPYPYIIKNIRPDREKIWLRMIMTNGLQSCLTYSCELSSGEVAIGKIICRSDIFCDNSSRFLAPFLVLCLV